MAVTCRRRLDRQPFTCSCATATSKLSFLEGLLQLPKFWSSASLANLIGCWFYLLVRIASSGRAFVE
jgi:hypothetical protein